MIEYRRISLPNNDFYTLVKDLDKELAVSDGDLHDYYHQYNGLEDIKHVVVAYKDQQAVGCGAIKSYDANTMEVKRMYVNDDHRKCGIGAAILKELEKYALDLDITRLILETGNMQPDAIRLYQRSGYTIIDNYDLYKDMDNSICFQKRL